jgi:hypothetical protein
MLTLVVILFIFMALQTTVQLSHTTPSEETSHVSKVQTKTTRASQHDDDPDAIANRPNVDSASVNADPSKSLVEAASEDLANSEDPKAKRKREKYRPLRRPGQIDQFHMIVDGKRKKIPFGTLPGTEAAGNVTMFEGDPTPPGCPHDYFTFVNNFGAHNNQLVTLLNAFAVAKNISRTLVIPPFIQGLNEFAVRRVHKPEKFYNFSLLREAGYCYVSQYSPHMGPLLKHAAYRLFRVLPANVSRPYHLLRPSLLVEKEVERTLARLPEKFTAVHRRVELRNMYSCQVPEEDKAGHCHMRVEFINEARRENNLSETEHFFLGTDAPQARLNASYIRYMGRLTSSHTGAAVVDMWVMTRAALFVGNPASSMSLNVCNVRRTHRPTRDCYKWKWCDDRPPYVAGWPCGSPLEGISEYL